MTQAPTLAASRGKAAASSENSTVRPARMAASSTSASGPAPRPTAGCAFDEPPEAGAEPGDALVLGASHPQDEALDGVDHGVPGDAEAEAQLADMGPQGGGWRRSRTSKGSRGRSSRASSCPTACR